MLTKIGNREMASSAGYSIRIDGMFRVIYSENDVQYQIHVEPLEEDDNGYNMMIESSSIKPISESVSSNPVSADDKDRIFKNLAEGLPVLGVRPWIHR